MASKKDSDLEHAKKVIGGLGLGHSDSDKREDKTGFRGKPEEPTRSEPVSGLAAALAGKNADEKADEEETPEAEAPETVEAPAPAKAETEATDDMDKVRRFLTLKKIPASAQEAMSDEELVEMRVSLLDTDHQRARLLDETSELRAKSERQKTETAEEAEPKRMVPAATKDLDAQLQKLVDDGDLSEGAAKTLSEAISASNQAVLDQVAERLAPVEEQTKSAQEAGKAEVQRLRETVRAEVGERFLGLDDPESLEGIEETFLLLAKQSRFEQMFAKDGREATIRALYEASARANGIVEVDAAGDKDRKRQRRESRAAGTPATTQRRSSAVDQMDMEPQAVALRAINKHRKKMGARW